MRLTAKSDLPSESQLMRQKRAQLLQQVKQAVKAASFGVERRVKGPIPKGMPRDFGRAAASWGHWSPGDIRPGGPQASSRDAVWEEKDNGLSITQGSNLDYVAGLNAGNSRQSPAGFLDAAEEAGQNELDQLIDDIMRTW